MPPPVVFEVEQAGCESCAARVRDALSPLGTVAGIEIDEAADAATVRFTASVVDEDAVNRALLEVSHGSGHAYRVKPGSWQPAV